MLDWNHWSPTLRAESRQRATAAGADFVLHYVDVPVDLAVRQADTRNAEHSAAVHHIEESAVRHFATIFRPPTPNEGLEIVRHGPTADPEA